MATTETLVKPHGATISSGKRQRILRENLLAYAFLAPALILLIIFVFYPATQAFWISLHRGEWGPAYGPRFVGLDNYQRMFGLGNYQLTGALDSKQFFNSLAVTLWYAFGTVPFIIALSLMIAVMLFQPIQARGFFRTAFFLPYVTSTVAAAAVWSWLFDTRSGFLNYFLSGLIGPQRWLQESTGVFRLMANGLNINIPGWADGPSLALLSIIVMTIWQSIGFYVIIFLAGLGNISKETYEAARIDGANEWQVFWKVTWPLLTPTTFFVLVISTIRSFEAFNQIYVMTGGGPLDTTRTVTMYIYQQFWVRTDRDGYASAVAIVLTLIILALTLFQQRILSRRVHYG